MEPKSSLGRLFAAQGVDDWEELLEQVCDKCPASLKNKCPEMSGEKGCCSRKNLIVERAIKAVNTTRLAALNFAETLRAEISR